YWIQETKKRKKRVEGHFPGASEWTLTKMKLLGASGDHEMMTSEEAIKRLELGYHITLRQSSIRPDLKRLLSGILAKGKIGRASCREKGENMGSKGELK